MKSHPLEQHELMAYLDGELRPDLATVAAVHLETCGECRAMAAELREISRQLAAWEIEIAKPETPAAISSAVEVHVKAQKKRVVEHRRTWRQIFGVRRIIWAGGLALVAIFLGALFVPNNLKSPQVAQFDRMETYARLSAPPATPTPAAQRERGSGGGFKFTNKLKAQDSLGTLQNDGPPAGNDEGEGTIGQLASEEKAPAPTVNGPMIARTAELALETREFEKARVSAEEILKRHGGYVGQLTVNAPEGSGRTLTATFRVPTAQLDAAMTDLKKLGRVENESQAGEEVTQQYVDLEARLANARHTEQRLSDLLRNRTGKLSDVLAFEKEIDRVRGEIESMEAQRKSLAKQVSYATLSAVITEDYSQQLRVVPPSTSTRFRNAAVEGYRALSDGIVSLLLFMLSAGPSILIWGGILFLVARVVWKKLRRHVA